MGKLRFGRVWHCFCLSSFRSGSDLCINNYASSDYEDELESKPLITHDQEGHLVKFKDVVSSPSLQLKPKMVVLKVSMHCNGCARKVEKHISKMEGATSYEVDLETKMVVVIGDIAPFQVLESVSKVKSAKLWTNPAC